ncbi:KN motif and ankyrin repeat domain-containing protein 3 [Nephila pilipes]|uniref:KN motif and ankyrin repeat domain-containing protein 3 n=1 Tax=Nephila pilipes TaxID=299642 RepID=A0A8X6TMM6_NEPPI|nr:KN motif and ankyrin repeat domain-containing protein 3 [Nephila pilipes]
MELYKIMPEKKDIDNKMSSNKCSCCPYGFHIDRDFVRYCDSLYNSAQLDKLRQHKRERRKEKKTVESYLGLGNMPEIITNRKSPITTSPKSVASLKSVTLPHDIHLQNDGLENAMLDFEDTWQKSLKKSCSSNDILTKRNGLSAIYSKPTKTFVDEQKNINFIQPSRSSSTSSVSSQSTAVSSTSVPVISDISYVYTASEQMTSSIDVLSKPRVNSPYQSMGINRTVLSNIRERMASSLQRMKELEDQVKTIPILQVKLYALAEEKKSLLNQLSAKQPSSTVEKSSDNQHHLENQLKRLENEGIMSPTLSRKCLSNKSHEDSLSSPGIASWLDANITKKKYIEKEIISHLEVNDVKGASSEQQKNMKNAATSCSVLTRDIGIGYVPSKLKSIAVGSDVSFSDLLISLKNKKNFDQCTSVSSESLESDSESLAGSEEHSRSFLQARFRKTVPSISNISHTPAKYYVASSTNTDIKYFNSKSVNTDQSLLKSIVSEPNDKIFKHKSISVSPSYSTKSLQTIEKASRSIGLQASLEVKSKSPEIIKKQIPKKDIGVGNFNINDIHCFNCKKIKKSIGIGDFSIKSVICDECSSLQPRSQPGNDTLMHNENCEKCVLRQTETVGVGDQDINIIECQNCEHVKSENSQKINKCSVSTNTSDDFSSTLSLSKSDIHICDKCSATIHSVAQGFAASTTDSKIPRPNIKVQANAGKTNHTKLAKLKIQVSKTQKVESSVVKSANSPVIQATEKKILTTQSSVTKTSTGSKNLCKDADELKEFSGPSLLPDFTNLPVLPHKKVDLSKEVKAACKVLNDYLQKPDRGGEKKTLSSLTIIQNEWFRVANQKKADPLLIEDYLDAYEDFSKLLLEKVVNLSDSNGNTALHYAISYGNFDVVSILIDSKVCDVNKKNKAGYTSIMLVALADMKNDAHHYVVQRLFSIGDINMKATQNGQTALMLAVSHGKKDIVKILLDTGAEVNLQDKDGSTALMCAAEHGHLEIVKILLSHPECDPTIVDSDDCNALTIAMEAGHKDIGLLIYTNMNFSRGSSPYSTLKTRKRSTPRSTPPPRTPTLRTPPLPSPSARSTNSIPSSFQFPT